MKNLARHIELLLHDNDCVILPGFGGFVAHDVPAYYVSEERLYYPPSRSISFNAAITMNDGLLTQSYMKSYKVDYARATYMVDMAIEQLTDMLDEEGVVTLPRIGVLKQDINQALQFTPDVAGISSPLHFGLGAFDIKELAMLTATTASKSGVNPKFTTKIISIRKEMLHRVMSTAAVLLLLLMIALPTGDHRPTDIAALNLTEIITAPQMQPVATTAAVEMAYAPAATLSAEEPIAVEPTEVEPIEATQTEESISLPQENACETEVNQAIDEPTATQELPVVPEEMVSAPAPAAIVVSEKTYHIIVASLPNHRGAEETMSQYTRMGYDNVSIVERDDRVRISLMQFADKSEANEQLKALRQQEKFQNAWLLAVRN